MVVIFELEAAKTMWVQMDNPPKWRERSVRRGEIYQLDVKPLDPRSNAVISHVNVTFKGVNRSNGKKMSGTLHPMWDASGLHYAVNSPLAGDGTYDLDILISMPTFGRVPEYRELWVKPVSTKFHFQLVGGMVTAVSEPMAVARQ